MKQEASTTDINHLRKEAPSKSIDLVGEVHLVSNTSLDQPFFYFLELKLTNYLNNPYILITTGPPRLLLIIYINLIRELLFSLTSPITIVSSTPLSLRARNKSVVFSSGTEINNPPDV